MVSENAKRWRRRAFLEGVGSVFQLFPSTSGAHERFVRRMRQITTNRPTEYQMFLKDLGAAMGHQMSTLSADEQERVRDRLRGRNGEGEEGSGSQLTLPFTR